MALSTIGTSFPDQTYSSSNKPSTTTLKTDISTIETALNSHASDVDDHIAATDAHGVAGAVVGTTSTQTLTNKTLTSPVLSGAMTSSDHIVLTPGSSKLIKLSVLQQDIAADSYKNNSVILTGWAFVQGDGAEKYTPTDTVTFGVTFAAAPIVIVSTCGTLAGSDPAAISDLTGNANGFFTSAWGISTTGFSANAYREVDVIGATIRVGYSWMAIGVLS